MVQPRTIDLQLVLGKQHLFTLLIHRFYRIIEFEKNAPINSGTYGTIAIEFWDVSGDMKYEKCWGPIIKDCSGIIFVLDPAAPQGEDQLTNMQRVFMSQAEISQKQTFLFVNHHNKGTGGAVPDVNIPKSFREIDKAIGTAEDSTFCV